MQSASRFQVCFKTIKESNNNLSLTIADFFLFVSVLVFISNVMIFCFLRLIVVAEKSVVYKRFPIPLINRLEKHFLNISTLLSPFQLELTRLLDEWTDEFITPLDCEHEE